MSETPPGQKDQKRQQRLSDSSGDGTGSVDLGEDLLPKFSRRASDPPPSTVEDLDSAPVPRTVAEMDEQFRSAKILRNEGLVEEAKKVLRRILIADGKYKPARLMLDEIHELELKQIFSSDEGTRRVSTRVWDREPRTVEVDGREVARKLDSDFQLGIFNEEGMEVPPKSVSLFDDPAELAAFGDKLDRDLETVASADRIDIGIAFKEMELHDLAIRQFEAVLRRRSEATETAEATANSAFRKDQLINATCLLALCHLEAGRPYEAVSALQPALVDLESTPADRVGLLYLMGRACEAQGNFFDASRWYDEARRADPLYRDVEERARKLKLKNPPRGRR